MRSSEEAMAVELMGLMEQLSRNGPYRLMHEFNRGEVFLLKYLSKSGGKAYPGEMSQAMQTSTARVAFAVKRMEQKGWVMRRSDPEDHRKTLVYITAEGYRMDARHHEAVLQSLEGLLDALGEEDAKHYIRIMRKIADFLPEQTAVKK